MQREMKGTTSAFSFSIYRDPEKRVPKEAVHSERITFSRAACFPGAFSLLHSCLMMSVASLQPILLEFVAEHPLTEAEERGSLALVGPGLLEGILYHAALNGFQRIMK